MDKEETQRRRDKKWEVLRIKSGEDCNDWVKAIFRGVFSSLCMCAVFALSPLIASCTQEAPAFSEEFECVFNKHKKSIPHLDQFNPPLLIFISGSIGMGKTHTTQEIERRFHAIRLSGDDVREIFKAKGYNTQELNNYFIFCIKKLCAISPNKMFIIDRSWDNHVEYYLQLAERFALASFVIRLSASRELALQRVISRGINVDALLRSFEQSYSNYMKQEGVKFDYYFDNTTTSNAQKEDLARAIREKMRFCSPQRGSKEYEETRKYIIDIAENAVFPEVCSSFSMILPGLYLGNQQAADQLVFDRNHFVTDVISCRSHPYLADCGIQNWLPVSLADSQEFLLHEHLDKVYDFIESAKGSVLVHCKAGASRSTAIVTSYLMKKYQIPFSVAYEYVKKKHLLTSEKCIFENQIVSHAMRTT